MAEMNAICTENILEVCFEFDEEVATLIDEKAGSKKERNKQIQDFLKAYDKLSPLPSDSDDDDGNQGDGGKGQDQKSGAQQSKQQNAPKNPQSSRASQQKQPQKARHHKQMSNQAQLAQKQAPKRRARQETDHLSLRSQANHE